MSNGQNIHLSGHTYHTRSINEIISANKMNLYLARSLNGRLIIFIKDDITKTDASATFLGYTLRLSRLLSSVTGVTAVKLRHAALLYVNIAPARPGSNVGNASHSSPHSEYQDLTSHSNRNST